MRAISPTASRTGLLLALAAGPAGWAAQLLIGYGLSSYACFPHGQALRQGVWEAERAVLMAANIGALAVIAAGLAFAFTVSRRLPLDQGANRMLAFGAVLSGAGFAVATLFGAVVIVASPTCWSFR